MEFIDVLLEIAGAVIKILIAVVLAVFAVNIGLFLFEKITKIGEMG